MSRVTLIHHINIQISDRERTREWYEKVLGAEFLDRGPELNKRQLQLRIGTAEIHTTDTAKPVRVPSNHFAVEIRDWDDMVAHLDQLGVPYSPRLGAKTGETGSSYGRRDYSSACYTYIHDPDGNMIELVHHPLGVEDSEGHKVELLHDPKSLRWATLPGYGSST
jgi:catechol 2,3-dioxygenase-like lactoylglutathione lyase family enzyme